MIQESLDSGLPKKYTPEIYKEKCDAVFDHIYDKYAEAGQSVYAATG